MQEALDTHDGTGQDDRPAVGHKRKCLLRSKHESLYIYVEHRVKVLFGDGAEGNEGPASRVREDDVEAPRFSANLRVDPVEVRKLGDVALDGCDVGPNGGHRGIKLRSSTAGDVDIGTFLDELLCRGEADAGTAARDESNLTFEFLGHCLVPCC